MKPLLLLAVWTSLAMAAAPPGIPDGWSDGFVYANGIRIHYYHAVPAPGKPVLVMAHGATDNGLSWTTTTWDLQAAYDIYMVDARGHGLSDSATAADTNDTAVEDLVGFLRAVKLSKPILMGHSMGAATVMRLAAQYPDLPRAIILLDPGLGVPVARGAAPPSAAPPSVFPALLMSGAPESLVAQNNRSFDDLVAQCRQQTPKWDPVDCQYWALSKKQFHGSYFERAGRGGGMSIADMLGKITAPTLILKADVPPDVRQANEAAAKALQNGKLIHVDDAGHNLHHDQRKRSVELIAAFLKGV
jgi:pimeloyl-ACP methyl ester carboxylesterase